MNPIDKIRNYYLSYLVDNPTDMAAFLSCFVPITFCLIYFRPCWNNYRILFYYSLIILFFDLLSSFFAAFSKNNHIIILTFFIFEAIFLVKFYLEIINHKKIHKIFQILAAVTILAVLINIFDGTQLVNDYSISIQSICFITISMISYYWILSSSLTLILSKSVLFWVTTGVFIYFSGIFFVYMFISTLLSDQSKNMSDLFIIANILIVIYRIFLAIGISQTKHIFKPINK